MSAIMIGLVANINQQAIQKTIYNGSRITDTHFNMQAPIPSSTFCSFFPFFDFNELIFLNAKETKLNVYSVLFICI